MATLSLEAEISAKLSLAALLLPADFYALQVEKVKGKVKRRPPMSR